MRFKSFTSLQHARDSAQRQLDTEWNIVNFKSNDTVPIRCWVSFLKCIPNVYIIPKYCQLQEASSPTSWGLFTPSPISWLLPPHPHNWLTLPRSISKSPSDPKYPKTVGLASHCFIFASVSVRFIGRLHRANFSNSLSKSAHFCLYLRSYTVVILYCLIQCMAYLRFYKGERRSGDIGDQAPHAEAEEFLQIYT